MEDPKTSARGLLAAAPSDSISADFTPISPDFFTTNTDTQNPRLLKWLCKEEVRERDSDKDGKVNFKEFFHGLFDLVRNYDEDGHNSSHESGDSLESPARTFFAQLDKDGDGFLSDVEMLPIIRKLHPSERYYAKQQADYIISQVDTDKDGRLSLTEMIESPLYKQSADVKKQTVFFLQTADVWSTSFAAEACRCGPQTADVLASKKQTPPKCLKPNTNHTNNDLLKLNEIKTWVLIHRNKLFWLLNGTGHLSLVSLFCSSLFPPSWASSSSSSFSFPFIAETLEFLTEKEKHDLDKMKEFEVKLVGPRLQVYEKSMAMKMWCLRCSNSYVLGTNWNEFVKENDDVLKEER
ncbi:hypothetical protein LXL04_013135 [Taraxacum kok-saghyz]